MISTTEKKIITKYLDNEATDKELQYLCEWLQTENNKKVFKDYLKTNYLLTRKYKFFNSEEAYDVFLKDIKEYGSFNIFDRTTLQTWLKYAAIFVGVIFISTFLYNRYNYEETVVNLNEISLQIQNRSKETFYIEDLEKIILRNGYKIGIVEKGKLIYHKNENNESGKLEYHVLKTPKGKRYEVSLSDGTHIYLNADSELRYPSYFSKHSPRKVYLKGEAFFEVTKDDSSPFIVTTDDLNTKVFGTKFNVLAYSDSKSTETVLVEGLIGIKANTETKSDYLIVNPSQKGYKLKNKKELVIEDVNVAKYIAWKDGVLMFENESTENIFRVLERHFNVVIQNNSSELNNHYFTGTFEQESIDEILNTISNHTHFEYSIKEGEIIIDKN